MTAKTPWPLLQKLAKADATAWAQKAARLRAELERVRAQTQGLAEAAPAYALGPQGAQPIELIRNQLRFKAKLDQMLLDLQHHGDKLSREREAALEQWRLALAKAEGYEKLAMAEKKARRDRRDRAEQQSLEEIAQAGAQARQLDHSDPDASGGS